MAVLTRTHVDPSHRPDLLPRAIGALVLLSRQGGAGRESDDDRARGVSAERLAQWGVAREEIEWLIKSSLVASADAHDLSAWSPELSDCRARGRRCCFVVTPAGVRFVEQIYAAIDLRDKGHPGDVSREEIPSWDGRELRYLGALLKRFERPGPNQERLLDEFQRQGWVKHIDNPLAEAGDISPADRLRDAVKRLNRSLLSPLLHFGGNGRGTGVCWRPLSPFSRDVIDPL